MDPQKSCVQFMIFVLVALPWFPEVVRAQTPATAITTCQPSTPSPALQPYVDPVPVMPRISLAQTTASNPVVVGAYKTTQKMHRDLPATTVYAFGTSQSNAATPGPTLVALTNVTAFVRWENRIPDANHMLPVDPTIDRASPRTGVPLVVHQHGGVTVASSDGHPDAWFTMGGERGPNFTTQNYTYSNAQPATMLWYHDHSFGYTRLSVPAGLAGFYLITNRADDPTWLPQRLREPFGRGLTTPKNDIHHFMIQDKQFFANGSLLYPNVGTSPNEHPSWCVDYFGDVMLVNGKVWPYLNVSRGVYRFRLLNACNSRFLLLSLGRNLTFVKVGVDGGYLNRPVRQTTIRLAPSERADVLIDFSGLRSGDNVTMENSAGAPFPSGPPPANRSVILFRVGSRRGVLLSSARIPTLTNTRNGTIQSTILQTTGLNISAVNLTTIRTRRFLLDVSLNATDGGLDQLFADSPRTFRNPPTEIVPLNTFELWEFINNVPGVTHPMHIHLINFVVLNQQGYNRTNFLANSCLLNVSFGSNQSCFTEAPQLPDDDHFGWKDTAIARTLAVTRFLVPFRPRDRSTFPFNATLAPGYVWHCHILEHEDNEMMRPLLFVNGNGTGS